MLIAAQVCSFVENPNRASENVREVYPPRPPGQQARGLIDRAMPPDLAYLDCGDKTGDEIAVEIAKVLLRLEREEFMYL